MKKMIALLLLVTVLATVAVFPALAVTHGSNQINKNDLIMCLLGDPPPGVVCPTPPN